MIDDKLTFPEDLEKDLARVREGIRRYLNRQNIEGLGEVDKLTKQNIRVQRNQSLDESIVASEEHSIIPIRLLKYEKPETRTAENEYRPRPFSMDELLELQEPALLLGDFGQGKSIGAIEIAEMLRLKDEYVVVVLRGHDIGEDLHKQIQQKRLDRRSISQEEMDKVVLEYLSQGTISLYERLKDEFKIVYIIDAIDEIIHNRDDAVRVLSDENGLRRYGKIIATSRFSGFNQYENSGFETLHLDPNSIVRNLDRYLEHRISDAEKRAGFKDLLMKQDDAVRTNYLLVYSLLEIYTNNPENLERIGSPIPPGTILLEGVKTALWDSKVRKGQKEGRPARYEWETDKQYENRKEVRDYNSLRENSLREWMDFLGRVSAYMTVRGQRSITKKEIEEIYDEKIHGGGGWTLAKEAEKRKSKGV